MNLTDALLVILTVAILVTGGVFYLWLQELRGCQDKLIEYYGINRTLGKLVLTNESDLIIPSGTPQLPIKIGVPGNISQILSCANRQKFRSVQEFIECQKVAPGMVA